MPLKMQTLSEMLQHVHLRGSPILRISHKVLVSMMLALMNGQSCSSALVQFSSTT